MAIECYPDHNHTFAAMTGEEAEGIDRISVLSVQLSHALETTGE